MANENSNVVVDRAQSHWSDLWKKEDYWAIWLGFALLIAAICIFINGAPASYKETIDKYNAIMKVEAEKAPFKTIAYIQAQDAKKGVVGTNLPIAKEIKAFIASPGKWTDNPVKSMFTSQAEADAKNAANKEKAEAAKAKAESSFAAAQAAEKLAADAGYKDASLNTAAEAAIKDWTKAKADAFVAAVNSSDDKETAFAELAPDYVSEDDKEDYEADPDASLHTGTVGSSLSYQSFGKWLMDDSRANGDVGVVESSSGYYAVMLLNRYRDETATADIRHILIKAEVADADDPATEDVDESKVPTQEALDAAHELGCPVLVRPSYVLGGQNMIVAYTKADVIEYMGVITEHVDMDHPVLLDKYIMGTECEVDAICDGENFLIPGIMEQVERTGVHSGDSICVYPAQHLTQAEIDTMVDYTGRFARELHVTGLVNVQYAVSNGKVYVIEVNPRSSRTVPYISKVTGVPMVDLAVRCCLGEKLADMGYGTGLHPNAPYVAVKVPVFSFEKLHGVDTQFGPEMKSTGEVLGIAPNYHDALLKGLIGAGYTFKTPGPASCCIFTVKDSDKPEFVDIAWKLKSMGYKLYGTSGTCAWLNKHMVPCNEVRNMSGEAPNIVDLLQSGLVDYVFSTSAKGRDPKRDSVRLRRKAVELSIPCITAVDTANALVDCLRSDHSLENIPLVDIATLYHRK